MQFSAGLIGVFAIGLIAACGSPDAEASGEGPVQITTPSSVPETVWSHATGACTTTDYADVPVRPFLGNGGKTVTWFAAAWPNYYATTGITVNGDMLAGMQRVKNPDGSCKLWIYSAGYRSSAGTPESYDTGLWMQSPYTTDGINVLALIHNEFHGELTAPPGQGSVYCTVTQAGFLPNNACSYWNMVGAVSSDGGDAFHLFRQDNGGGNLPVLASAHPYTLPADNGGRNPGLTGLITATNIIHWGPYDYVLVQSFPAPDPNRGYGQPVGRNGMCIYRTQTPFERASWRGWDGQSYSVPPVPSYPSSFLPRYVCKPVISGMYRFSWSYNIVLGQFILLGLDTQAGQGTRKFQAFVYTTARLKPDGELIQTSNEHLLRVIDWLDAWRVNPSVMGEAYPSLLDPQSPQIGSRLGGTPDLNFQFSGAHPYLYFVLLHPRGSANAYNNRDVVRQQLTVTR